MRLLLFVAADCANMTADNKLNVIGVFNEIRAAQFPALRATLPRHDDLAKAYVAQAIELIDRLEDLQAGGPDAPGVD